MILRLRALRRLRILAALRRPAAAQQSVADFYNGKTITCYIGYGVGGGYDLFARTISRHMPRHIPGNPTILPVNMPGASSMILANHLAKRAPQDGTAFGAVNSALVFDTLFAGAESKAQFNGPDMTMIGNAVSLGRGAGRLAHLRREDARRRAPERPDRRRHLAHRRHLSPAARDQEHPRPRQDEDHPRLSGHARDRDRARARRDHRPGLGHGGHQGRRVRTGSRDGSLNIVAQLAPKKMPEVPASVPLVKDYVPNDDDKRVLDVIFISTVLARPYIAPPNIPADRAQALRDAFMATMKDPAFLAETKKLQLTIDPTSGEEMERIVRDAYALPDAIIAKVRKALLD